MPCAAIALGATLVLSVPDATTVVAAAPGPGELEPFNGACCLDDGSCLFVGTAEECEMLGGIGHAFLHCDEVECAITLPCRVTGGGIDDNGMWDGTHGQGDDATNVYTFGGQAGAPGGAQPQPYGEWTHHQKNGPDGSFVFHAGTASAPPGTEIDRIECSDPGWCMQARPAPSKQIDFEGVGTFKNIRNSTVSGAGAVAGESYHWFEVHIEDLGEPGKGGKQEPPSDECPPDGSAGAIANCDCPDFYEITIYAPFDPDSESPNTTDVIYHVHGYIRGGNLQIHPGLD
jgi:hypothetical protein